MNTRHAQIVLTIVRFGSITAAAKALYITQPTLSATLKQIETQLGEAIFQRGKSPLELTPAGELYVQAARRVIQIETQLHEAVASLQGRQEGTLHLGMPEGRACELLPHILPDYRSAYPSIRIEVTEGSAARLEQMAAGREVDVALIPGDGRRQDLTYRLIGSEEIVLLCGRRTALAQRLPSGSTINLAEAANERFVLPDVRRPSRRMFEEMLERSGVRAPDVPITVDSLEAARRICASCHMVMLSPLVSCLSDAAGMQRLAYYHLAGDSYLSRLSIAHPTDTALPPYAEAFCTLLTNRYRAMSAYRV